MKRTYINALALLAVENGELPRNTKVGFATDSHRQWYTGFAAEEPEFVKDDDGNKVPNPLHGQLKKDKTGTLIAINWRAQSQRRQS